MRRNALVQTTEQARLPKLLFLPDLLRALAGVATPKDTCGAVTAESLILVVTNACRKLCLFYFVPHRNLAELTLVPTQTVVSVRAHTCPGLASLVLSL